MGTEGTTVFALASGSCARERLIHSSFVCYYLWERACSSRISCVLRLSWLIIVFGKAALEYWWDGQRLERLVPWLSNVSIGPAVIIGNFDLTCLRHGDSEDHEQSWSVFLDDYSPQGQFAEINSKSGLFYLGGDAFCVAPSAILCSCTL